MAIQIIDDLNNTNYAGDGVDRQRWKFDENGFALATTSALLQAQPQVREQIKSLHDDVVATLRPSDFQVTVGGVPIDKAELDPK